MCLAFLTRIPLSLTGRCHLTGQLNLRSTEHLTVDETFDYVIVGSGVSGAATAMELLDRNPGLSILMLEGRAAASGASGRNGGHCKTGDWKHVEEWVGRYGEDEALKIGKIVLMT